MLKKFWAAIKNIGRQIYHKMPLSAQKKITFIYRKFKSDESRPTFIQLNKQQNEIKKNILEQNKEILEQKKEIKNQIHIIEDYKKLIQSLEETVKKQGIAIQSNIAKIQAYEAGMRSIETTRHMLEANAYARGIATRAHDAEMQIHNAQIQAFENMMQAHDARMHAVETAIQTNHVSAARAPLYDMQNVEHFLGEKNQSIRADSGTEWFPLDRSFDVQIPLRETGEVQLCFSIRNTGIENTSEKIRITPIFDNILHEAASLELTLAEGHVAFRIVTPENYTRFTIRIGSLTHSAAINNLYSALHTPRGISVITGVHKDEIFISKLLNSIASQDLGRDKFEAIFIVNGEKDNSEKIIRQFISENPELNIKYIYEEKPSLSHARNIGIRNAGYSHVTFVDCDDTLSESYLKSMYERLAARSIACSNIINIDEDGNKDIENGINASLLALKEKSSFLIQHTPNLATMSACKAISTFMARCVPFHTQLKNGEDTPFYCEIYARFPLITLNADDDDDRCVYYRLMRSDSLSRQPLNYEFNIRERLAVMKEISRTLSLTQDKSIQSFNLAKMGAQIWFMAPYIQSFPQDYIKVLNEIKTYDIPNFPMERLKDNSTTQLIVSYCNPSHQESVIGNIAREIGETGELYDIIINETNTDKEDEVELLDPVKNFIDKHIVLNTLTCDQGWPRIREFAALTLLQFEKAQTNRHHNYVKIYSQTRNPESHFSALLIKLKHPHIFWVAEPAIPSFNDEADQQSPLKITDDWLSESGLLNKLEKMGVSYDKEQRDLFYWYEITINHLADNRTSTGKQPH